jgi:hypothetical protein
MDLRLMTEGALIYKKAGRAFAEHSAVDHTTKEYAHGRVSTNIPNRLSPSSSAACMASSTASAKSTASATPVNSTSAGTSVQPSATTM